MRGSFKFFFMLLFLFTCCKEVQKEYTVQEVNRLHRQIDSLQNDSTYYLLKRLDTLLLDKNRYPDSLRNENHFLLGTYFDTKNKKDSASYHYWEAANGVKGKFTSERQPEYFKKAYYAFSNLELYGNCLLLADKYKTHIDTTKQFRSYSFALHYKRDAYFKLKDYQKAYEVVKQLVAHAQENDSISLPYAILTLARLEYKYLGQKEKAKKNLLKILEKPENLSYNYLRQYENRMGIYEYFDGNYTKALTHYLKAIEAAKNDSLSTNFISNLAVAYNNTGEVYIDLEKYDLARQYLDSVNYIGISNLKRDTQRELLKYEMRLESILQRDIKTVYNILDSINNHQDHIYKEKLNSELQALRKANEKEIQISKEKQEAELKSKQLKNILFILAISGLFLILMGILIYQRRKIKFEKQELLTQQKLLRSQMNPHFIFNTLYTIKNKIKIAPDEASDYLTRFSRLLQLSLENSIQNFTLLEDELEALNKYLDLMRIRFPNTFTYEIQLENLEHEDPVYIPPMLIQPFVENSIMHGFKDLESDGEIIIALKKTANFIECTISDNGSGYIPLKNQRDLKSSTYLISKYLKKQTKKDVHYNYLNTQNKTGTKVTFYIPFSITEND